jgi:thiaminase/transcriptional activator TenA
VTPDYPDWAAAMPEGRFTDWLKERAEPAWSAACGHRFTVEIADGSLEAAVFRRYLVQDYAFIETLATVLGFAIARAPGMDAKKRLTGFLAALTSDENDYFLRAFDAVGVGEGERTAPELAPVTRDFRDLMLAAAEAGTYEDLLAVIVPAEWIYLTWASGHADAAPSQLHYLEWIELHIDPAFADFVDWLRAELDAIGPDLDEARRREIEARFQRLVALEVAFFDQAYGE